MVIVNIIVDNDTEAMRNSMAVTPGPRPVNSQ